MEVTPSSDHLDQLIEKAAAKDQQAFNRLLNLYWTDVYRFLSSKNLTEEDVEDLTIQTFAKVFEKLDTYDRNRSFKTWILTIANNNYIDLLRKNSNMALAFADVLSHSPENERTYLSISDNTTPETEMILKQSADAFIEALSQMKPNYRRVLELYYLKEEKIGQIAQQLDLSISNVKIILMRGRKLLLKTIK